MRRCILVVLLTALGGCGHAVTQPRGILVATPPAQAELDRPGPQLSRPGYRITALEHVSLEARVLGAEPYWFDHGAELAPIDLALGWGPMSDTAVLDRISISQRGRFYFWQVARFPIPRHDIEVNSANMHMIPADAGVERTLKAVRVGQVVRLDGYLVEVNGSDGFRWRSSLKRDDTGDGSCELVWIENLQIL
jgi:hypothetical protein